MHRKTGGTRATVAQRALATRNDLVQLQLFECAITFFYFLWNTHQRESCSHGNLSEGSHRQSRCRGTRNGVSVRACGRIAEQTCKTLLDVVADDVFPLACFVVGTCPGKTDHIGEKTFGQTVAPHDSVGKFLTGGTEGEMSGIHLQQPGGLHALDHLRYRGA